MKYGLSTALYFTGILMIFRVRARVNSINNHSITYRMYTDKRISSGLIVHATSAGILDCAQILFTGMGREFSSGMKNAPAGMKSEYCLLAENITRKWNLGTFPKRNSSPGAAPTSKTDQLIVWDYSFFKKSHECQSQQRRRWIFTRDLDLHLTNIIILTPYTINHTYTQHKSAIERYNLTHRKYSPPLGKYRVS